MAADNVTPIEQVEDRFRQGYSDVTAMQKAGFEAALASSQAMIKGYQALGAETLAFMQSRMKSGLEASQKLASCGSPQGAVEIQVDYAQAAMQAYMDEARKIGDLCNKLVTDSLEPLRKPTETMLAKASASAAA